MRLRFVRCRIESISPEVYISVKHRVGRAAVRQRSFITGHYTCSPTLVPNSCSRRCPFRTRYTFIFNHSFFGVIFAFLFCFVVVVWFFSLVFFYLYPSAEVWPCRFSDFTFYFVRFSPLLLGPLYLYEMFNHSQLKFPPTFQKASYTVLF